MSEKESESSIEKETGIVGRERRTEKREVMGRMEKKVIRL